MAQYMVREGESLLDVCYNACGSLSALYLIMTLNSLDTFTPQLKAGQILQTPETRNNDGVLVANKRPFNSNLVPIDTLDAMFETLEPNYFQVLTDDGRYENLADKNDELIIVQ